MALSINKLKQRLRPQSKEEASFEAIFNAHWNRVMAVLFRLVGDQDEAQDLALEVFWRLHRQPPTDRRNLGGWLYRVATNLGLNALRARKRRQRYEEQAGQHALERSPIANPAVIVERNEQREQVQRVMLQIKPRSAQLLTLRYSGFSYAELAEVVNVSPRSIGTLLARAEREFEKAYRALEGG